MSLSSKHCCVLNGGNSAWAFETIAEALACQLGIDVSRTPRRFNYLLQIDDIKTLPEDGCFIPPSAIRLASDKRLLATRFVEHSVPAPETHLIPELAAVETFANQRKDKEWCLKYPTSSGANGHRLWQTTEDVPANWPIPFVLQEFVRLEKPEVYRTFCAGQEIFGWAIRKFPAGAKTSPWVAHARGARYECSLEPPKEAMKIAEAAFNATGLLDSFGCVDLIRKPTGEWLVLEVGTDGIFNHVDRDFGDQTFAEAVESRIRDGFWKSARSLNL